jgi:hypothetical protein
VWPGPVARTLADRPSAAKSWTIRSAVASVPTEPDAGLRMTATSITLHPWAGIECTLPGKPSEVRHES